MSLPSYIRNLFSNEVPTASQTQPPQTPTAPYKFPLIGDAQLKEISKAQYEFEVTVDIRTTPSRVVLTVIANDDAAAHAKIEKEIDSFLRRNTFVYTYKLKKIEDSIDKEEAEDEPKA